VLNISLLYQTFGLSINLVAGVFTSITHFIMHDARQNQQQQQEQQNQLLLTLNQNHNPRGKVNKSIINSKKNIRTNIRMNKKKKKIVKNGHNLLKNNIYIVL